MENDKKEIHEDVETLEALDTPGTPLEFTAKVVLALLILVFVYVLFWEVNNRFPK